MRTTAVTTAAGPILALDLGKYKCVACAYHAADRYTFHAIVTSVAQVERLIRCARLSVVVIEACSLAGWVSDRCREIGVGCRVANTSAEAWKYKHAQRKPDRDDALRLAQRYALGQLPEVVVPPKAAREWRALIAFRQALVSRRMAAQNRMRSILVGQRLPAPRGARAWTQPRGRRQLRERTLTGVRGAPLPKPKERTTAAAPSDVIRACRTGGWPLGLRVGSDGNLVAGG